MDGVSLSTWVRATLRYQATHDLSDRRRAGDDLEHARRSLHLLILNYRNGLIDHKSYQIALTHIKRRWPELDDSE